MLRAKKEGVKLNSVFELISCLALKKLYQSLRASNEEFSKLFYHTVISLRDGQRTRRSSINEEIMGLVSGGLLTNPDTSSINKIFENQDRLSEFFWPFAKKCSDEMHYRLKNDPTRFYVKCNPLGKEEMNFHFTSTNVGEHCSSEDAGLNYFKLPNPITCVTSEENVYGRMFFIWIAVRFKKLYFGVGFNSHFVDISIMKSFRQFFIELINELVRKEPLQSNL